MSRALLLTVATVCALLLTSWGGTVYPWLSPMILGAGAGAALFLSLFIWHERAASEPLMPLRLFRNQVFVIAVVVTTMTAMALFGAFVFLPTYFQLVLGLSPSTAGLLTAADGRLDRRVGRGWAGRLGDGAIQGLHGYGLVIATGALVVAATVIAASAPLSLIRDCALEPVLGAGLGLVMPNLTVAIQNAVARDDLGVATSASSFMRSLGGSFGVAIAGAIVAARLAGFTAGRCHGRSGRAKYSTNRQPPRIWQQAAVSAAVRQASVETFCCRRHYRSSGLRGCSISPRKEAPLCSTLSGSVLEQDASANPGGDFMVIKTRCRGRHHLAAERSLSGGDTG